MANEESKTPKKETTPKTTKASSTSAKPATSKSPTTSSKTSSPSATKPETAPKSSVSSSTPTKTTITKVPAKSTTPVASKNPSPIASKSSSPVGAKANTSIDKDSKLKKDAPKKPKEKDISKEDLNKNLIAEDNQEEKKKKRKLLLIIFFIILGLAVLSVGIYFLTKVEPAEIRFSVQIDSDIQATFEDENGNEYLAKYYPGDLIKGHLDIIVKNENGTISRSESVYLRFKIEVEIDDNYYAGLFIPVFSNDDWFGDDANEESPDNYFYYNKKCYGDEELRVFEYLDFVANTANNILNGKENATIIFTVEILEGNRSAISQEWFTAPPAWRRTVRG